MNRGEYQGDPRYRKVLEQMDLLGIMDVSTTRQSKNGTIIWKLPIRNVWKSGKFIEVKRTAFIKDKKVVLEGKNVLTRIMDVKGESWREYPTFYKIGDYYYV